LENKYVADDKLRNRRLVMYNDFIIIGPKDDPARIRSTKTATAVLQAIAGQRRNFVSRGDKSGTHTLERASWKSAGIEPKDSWYIDATSISPWSRASAPTLLRIEEQVSVRVK
jgi:tungstate transport system substrate-binding protein